MGFQIAIDGPAGAGKSSIAKELARELAFTYLDTGAMYRTLGLASDLEGRWPETEEERIGLCERSDISVRFLDGDQHIFLNGKDVSSDIRTERCGNLASAISVFPEVRERMVALQQALAADMDVIMDGRDIGTVVLPDAQMKIYLTADVEERAMRRVKQLREKGGNPDFDTVLEEMKQRDIQDTTREASPLKKAKDGIVVDSTNLTIPETLAVIRAIYELRKNR
ncbi:MAG: (d)CMP kinase [Eubacterium sp.]|nr:(d)CMP kinase [Eubacterium sp.]